MPRPQLIPGTWGNVNVTRLSSGGFEAEARYRYFSGDTRKVRARGTSASGARNNLVAKLQGLGQHQDGGSALSPNTTIADLADFWLAEKRVEGLARNTLRGYRSVVENQVMPAIGALRIRECRTSVIDKVLKDRALSGASTKKLRNALNQMFALAVRHDVIPINPTRDAARVSRPRKEVAFLTAEQAQEVRALIASAMERNRPGPKMSPLIRDVVDFMLGTGCRIGEVLALRWEDLDLACTNPTATISGTVVTEAGRGTSRQPWPKTVAGFRSVHLPSFVVEMLLQRMIEAPANPLDAVFATRNGTWNQVANLETQWNRVVDNTAYDWVTFHVFRKSVATHIDRTVDAKAAAAQLGHSSEAVTLAHYINKPKLAPDLTQHLEAFRPSTSSRVEGA